MCDSGDILLFALSARRKVSWRNFKRYFDEIRRKSASIGSHSSNENAAGHRWWALRTLSYLGHIDLRFSSSGIEVIAAPPTLAPLPGFGTSKAVLCGARSPQTISAIEEAATDVGVEASIGSQAAINPYAPSRIELCAENVALIHAVSDRVGLYCSEVPPARLLAQASASLQEYRHRLIWSDEPELDWQREDYDIDRLRFRMPQGESPSWRLSRYKNPTTSILHYRLWQGDYSTEVDLDWGRYAILAKSSRHTLQYNREKKTALVSFGAPLPVLLARAFGLCSGYPPILAEETQSNRTGRYYEFKNMLPSIFNTVANKVGQQGTRRR